MASGPYFDERRGTWSIQWKDGARWRRKVVVKKRPGWKQGDPAPARPPKAAQLALAEYARRELASGGQGSDWETTVAGFLAAWQQRQKVMGKRPNTLVALERAVNDFLAWCEGQGVTLLHEVTPKVCDGFVVHWRSNGRGYEYVKQQRGLLAPAWRKAVKQHTLPMNPWEATDLGEPPRRSKRPSWTPDEFARLLTVCEPWLADVLLGGCYTGMRITALIGFEWPNVRWLDEPGEDFGEVVVTPELDKAREGYEVPIHRKLHDMLARRLASKPADCDRVFLGRDGRPIDDYDITARAIQKTCKTAGLPVPKSPNHAMRRTFGRWAVLGHLTGKPIDIYKVSRWMGHHSIDQTLEYLDLDRQTSRESMRDDRPEKTAKPKDEAPPDPPPPQDANGG